MSFFYAADLNELFLTSVDNKGAETHRKFRREEFYSWPWEDPTGF